MNVKFSHFLFVTVSCFAVCSGAQSACAASAKKHVKKVSQAQTHSPATVKTKGQSQIPPVSAIVAPKSSAEDITVSARGSDSTGVTGRQAGGGLISYQTTSKTMITISRDFIAKQGPTANPYQLVAMSPGVNVAANDPFGVQGSSITVRGLSTDEIGVLLDGMPTNDPNTSNSYAPQYVAAENLESIDLQPMGGDPGAPLYGSGGGIMSLKLRDPSHKFEGFTDFTYGSYNTDHEFLRLDTGDIGHTGLRAYLSYSHLHGDEFVGPGVQNQHHFDFKAVEDWNRWARSSLTITGTLMNNTNLINPALSSWNKSGIKSGAYDAVYTANDTNYWKLHQAPFYPIFVSWQNHLQLSKNVSFDINPFYEHALGGNSGASTLSSSGAVYVGNQSATADLSGLSSTNGKVIVSATTTARFDRSGVSSKLKVNVANHELFVSDFFDYNAVLQAYAYTPVRADGGPAVTYGDKRQIYATLANGTHVLLASQDTTTYNMANGIAFGDHANFLNNRLTVDAGIKMLWFDRSITNRLPGAQYQQTFSDLSPMPYLGTVFHLTTQHQFYANVSTNTREPNNTSLIDAYSTSTGAKTTSANPDLKNEFIISEEIGYRYHADLAEATISFFNYNMTNHQISTTVVSNGANVTEAINVGGQTSRGVDVEAGFRPWHHFRPYVSFEYLHAANDTDFNKGSDYLPTKGKVAVRSPHETVTFGIDYDAGHFFASGDMRYVSSQYSTLMNDEKMPGYATGNIAIGYRFDNFWRLRTPQIRLNFNNVSNNHYLTGVAGVTSNAKSTKGINGSTIAGSSPTYYIGSTFAVMFSMSTGF